MSWVSETTVSIKRTHKMYIKYYFLLDKLFSRTPGTRFYIENDEKNVIFNLIYVRNSLECSLYVFERKTCLKLSKKCLK